jgi:hypothetical protein
MTATQLTTFSSVVHHCYSVVRNYCVCWYDYLCLMYTLLRLLCTLQPEQVYDSSCVQEVIIRSYG